MDLHIATTVGVHVNSIVIHSYWDWYEQVLPKKQL